MRAGHGIRYRVHALELETNPIAIAVGKQGMNGPPSLIIEFAHKPSLKLIAIAGPRFLCKGAPTGRWRTDNDADGACYLTVISAGEFAVPDSLSETLARNPSDGDVLNQIEEAIAEQVTTSERPSALLAASVCAANLAPAVLE